MEKGPLLGAGRTADVYAWGDDRVLKLFKDWMPADPIEREFTITRLASQAGLPVPAAEELVQVDGRLGITFERIRGVPLLQTLQARPSEINSIACLLAELHARMHAFNLPPDAPAQREQIEQGVAWAKDLSETEKEAIRGVLAGLPDDNVLCHGDFHLDNVLMTENGPVIIDWMTGRGGHPLADVARTVLLIQYGGMPPDVPVFMRILIDTFRPWFISEYLKRYLQLHPASQSGIEAWQLPLLAARLFEVENYPAEKKRILARIHTLLAKMEQ